MEHIKFLVDDPRFTAETFLSLVQRVWPGEYKKTLTAGALRKTLNISAWDGNQMVGSVRILTDGYYFGTIPEILVDPDYQKKGIGRTLMDLAWEHSPTSLFLGAQAGNEDFFKKMGFQPSMASFVKKKPRKQ